MRIIVAIIVCVFFGALAYGVAGVILGVLVGLVVGLIWHGNAKQKKVQAAAPTPTEVARTAEPRATTEERVAALEARLERLERRVTGGAYVAGDAIETPVPEAAGEIPMAATAPMAAAAVHTASPSAAWDAASTFNAEADAAPAIPASPELPEPPAPPRGPTLIQRLLSGNVVAKLGIVILIFGIAFAVKFALENAIVPVEVWFALATLVGIALLVVGWRLRGNETGYGLIVQGGGVGVLYVVTFGALKLYQLLPPSIAFLILVAIVLLSAILAILQDSVALAAIGISGGFLAPILASTGEGSHVALFTYYAILNFGIFVIAWFKAWRVLNVLGFVFTVLIAAGWGEEFYAPEMFASTEPFLILFFAMYVGIAILFATRQAPNLKHYVDGTIVFGTPITVFGMQAAMVHHIPYAMAFSALAMGFVYVVLATILYSRHRESLRLLVESFFALALIFGTLAIPLALDAQWTSAAWAVEGAAVMWAGIRQQRIAPRFFGLLLQLGAALAFLSQAAHMPAGGLPIINSSGLGMLMIAIAALFSAWQLDKHGDRITAAERQLSGIVFGWGCLWWLALGISETDRQVPDRWLPTVGLAFLAASGVAFSVASRMLAWRVSKWPALLLLPFYLALALASSQHPFDAGGGIAWPIAIAVHYGLLRRHDDDEDLGRFARRWLGAVHAGSVLLIALLGAWELHWWPAQHGLPDSAWTVAAAMIVPALLLGLIAKMNVDRWPMSAYRDHYLLRAGSVLAIALIAWMWMANITHDGSSEPLPYLPILNALDLGHLLAGLAIATWWLRLHELGVPLARAGGNKGVRVVAGLTLFFWLNAILLRTLHHWMGIPYAIYPMWDSRVVQASLSIFWTILAFALMLIARNRRERLLWTIGAGLMGVVVAKLFLADLSNLAGIVRIVAFLGVGVLMLLMGYFVPLPQKAEANVAPERAQ